MENLKSRNRNISEVIGKLEDPEIVGTSRKDFEIEIPCCMFGRGCGDIVIKVSLENHVVSSVEAQETLQELADKKSEKALENIKNISQTITTLFPGILDSVMKQKEEKTVEEKQQPEWMEKFDKLVMVLTEPRDARFLPKNYLNNILNDESAEQSKRDIATWALVQSAKKELGVLEDVKLAELLEKVGL